MIPVRDNPDKGRGYNRARWMPVVRVDIYSDTVCPWCYLGKRRFELALAARPEYEPRVTWRPFELNPEIPLEGLDYSTYWAAKMAAQPGMAEANADLARLGEASAVQFRFDLIRRVPNTRRSHLLIAHAARCGLQEQVLDRIMRAYFEEGRDIGDPDELVRLGGEAGLVEAEARHALILRRGQDGVVAAQRHAAVLGITGVPTYVFDGQYTISGAQEVAIFARVLDQVAEFANARGVAT
jgi:predicted DsbA family dithiol-disulfide isomerase